MNRIARLLSLTLLTALGLSPLGCGSSSDDTASPPGAPTGLTATAATGAVGLAWAPVAGATSYGVYRGTATGALSSKTKIASPTSPAYNDTAVTNGTPYYYQVTASNGAGESAGSTEASATPSATAAPAAPTGVTASAASTQVTVTWTAVPGATSYNVYWSTSATVTQSTGTKIPGATSGVVVGSLTNGVTYYFVVTAVNGNGESVDSLRVNATPAAAPPYIRATVIHWPFAVTGVPILEVEVFTAADRNTPVTNATATVNGTPLTYVSIDRRYEASTPMVAPGATVTVVVTIPAGSLVAAGTYSASGTMYTASPTVTSPPASTTWARNVAHDITWTAGAPTATSPASAYVVGIMDPTSGDFFPTSVNGGPFEVSIGTTSYTMPANTLPAAGTYIVWIGIATAGIVEGTATGIPFTTAATGSGLRVGLVSNYVQFTAN